MNQFTSSCSRSRNYCRKLIVVAGPVHARQTAVAGTGLHNTATRCSRFRGIPLQIEMGFLNKVWKGSANKLKVGTMRGADRHTRVRRRAPCRAMESGTMRQGERERVLRAETWVRHRKRPSPSIAAIECTWSVHVVCKGAHQLYTAIDV